MLTSVTDDDVLEQVRVTHVSRRSLSRGTSPDVTNSNLALPRPAGTKLYESSKSNFSQAEDVARFSASFPAAS